MNCIFYALNQMPTLLCRYLAISPQNGKVIAFESDLWYIPPGTVQNFMDNL